MLSVSGLTTPVCQSTGTVPDLHATLKRRQPTAQQSLQNLGVNLVSSALLPRSFYLPQRPLPGLHVRLPLSLHTLPLLSLHESSIGLLELRDQTNQKSFSIASPKSSLTWVFALVTTLAACRFRRSWVNRAREASLFSSTAFLYRRCPPAGS